MRNNNFSTNSLNRNSPKTPRQLIKSAPDLASFVVIFASCILQSLLLFLMPAPAHEFQLFICVACLLGVALWNAQFGSDKCFLYQSGLYAFLIAIFTASVYRRIASPFGWDGFRHFWTIFNSRGHADPLGEGYQSVVAQQWLSASRMFGSASNINGMNVEESLPYAVSDFSIVYLIAKYGWVAGIAVTLLLAVFLILLLRRIIWNQNVLSCYVSLGCWMLLAIRFIVGIAVNFSWIPTINIPVPFISFGMNGNFVNMLLTGIIIASFGQPQEKDIALHVGRF